LSPGTKIVPQIKTKPKTKPKPKPFQPRVGKSNVHDKRRTFVRKTFYAESGTVGPIDSKGGIELNNREISSLGDRPEYTGDHELSDATIRELPWDLARIVQRPTLVSSFQWGTTSTSPLFSYLVPGDLLTMKLAQIPFDTFLFWKGDVVLKLQVAGSPLVQGIIAMSFVPLINNNELPTISWDLCSLTINPTVYLFANTNTSAELRIPYNHFQSYLNTNFINSDLSHSMGFVIIYIISPFITSGSVTSVTVSLFSQLENSEFKVPRLSSVISTMPHGEAGILDSALHSLLSIGSDIVEPFYQGVSNTAKSVMNSVMSITPKNLIEHVSGKALPSNFIGDAIDVFTGGIHDVLGVLGMDNPTIPNENMRTIVKPNGSLNYAVGPEHIEKMAVMPSALSLVTPETFATISDEMDVNYLYRKYSYFGSFTIHTTDSIGAVLMSIPLSPFPTLLNASPGVGLVNVGSIIQNIVNFPLISYLGLPYRYWTGGIRYKFMVSASSMHTCKIFVAFNYGNYTAPSTLVDAASQYGTVIEISQGSQEFEFTVPYNAVTPYLDVSAGCYTSTNSMGLLNIVILNSLVAPDSVSSSIEVAMFICGSTDFSYEFLCGYNPAVPVAGFAPSLLDSGVNEIHRSTYVPNRRLAVTATHVKAESGVIESQTTAPMNMDPTITDVATNEDEGEERQVAPPQVESIVDDHFGITNISIRDLLKKYQLVGEFYFSQIMSLNNRYQYTTLSLKDMYRIPMLTTTSYTPAYPVFPSRGLLTWAAGMYRQFKGGLRFKVVINPINSDSSFGPFTSAIAYLMPGTIPSNYSINGDILSMMPGYTPFQPPTGSSITSVVQTPRLAILNGSLSNVLEFEVPYNSNQLSVLTTSGLPGNESYENNGQVIIILNCPDSASYRCIVYVALADEARFGTLYRVPSLYVPGVFSVSGSDLTPTGNIGAGQYGPTGMFAESGVNPVVAQVDAQQVQSDVKLPTPALTSSNIPSNKTSGGRRGHQKKWNARAFGGMIQKFSKNNPSAGLEEYRQYILSICPATWRQGLNMARVNAILRTYGVQLASDRRFRPVPYFKRRRNRKNIRHEQNTRKSVFTNRSYGTGRPSVMAGVLNEQDRTSNQSFRGDPEDWRKYAKDPRSIQEMDVEC